jgi:hypothetical protein
MCELDGQVCFKIDFQHLIDFTDKLQLQFQGGCGVTLQEVLPLACVRLRTFLFRWKGI